jgi:hypothetical protein
MESSALIAASSSANLGLRDSAGRTKVADRLTSTLSVGISFTLPLHQSKVNGLIQRNPL